MVIKPGCECSRGLATALLSAIALAGITLPAQGNALPDIGRLQRATRDCISVSISGGKQRCFRLQIDRKTNTVLRVRFIGNSGSKGMSRTLTFVANDVQQSLPLLCQQGRCALSSSTWEAPVIGVSESLSNRLGITDSLPRAWPAQGECKIANDRIHCQARLALGNQISANAKL